MKMKNYLSLILICMSFIASAQSANGFASFIGDEFHKLKMASGETYDKTTMVAQHRDLAYGTKVKVTNNNNGETVIVTIKDRGPFMKGEIIGLSHAAGKALGMVYGGKKAPVRIEVVGAGNTVIATDSEPKARSTTAENTTKRKTEVEEYNKPTGKLTPKKAAVSTPKKAPKKAWSSSTGIYKADIMDQPKKGYGVQVGVFSDMNTVIERVMALKTKGFNDVFFTIDTENGKTSYKIILGNYDSQAKASSYKKNLKAKFRINGFIVNFVEL
ncbi:MAG: rare lipoprotein A [Cognaticolwellia sp.]|jgi:rare lipoprotein A